MLRIRLGSLVVFRALLNDPVISSLRRFLESPSESEYADFLSELYKANGGDIGSHIEYLCQSDENVYVKNLGKGDIPPVYISESVKEELKTLQYVAELTPEILCAGFDEHQFSAEVLPHLKLASLKATMSEQKISADTDMVYILKIACSPSAPTAELFL